MDFNLKRVETTLSDDRSFIEEILTDFFVELHAAMHDFQDIIDRRDSFADIKQTAHKIKGSASYLSCEKIEKSAELLESLGKQGMSNPSKSLWDDIESEYNHFRNCFYSLKDYLDEHRIAYSANQAHK
jgi:HPt (histidine-containing phosphotransfer) domain-containing protein